MERSEKPRMAQNLAKNRAQAVEIGFFQIVKKKVAEIELRIRKPLSPTNIWNCDESDYCSSQGDNVILCRKGFILNNIYYFLSN